MLKLNGEDEDGETGVRCPGKGECDRFTAARGRTHQQKAKNACPGCPRNCTPPLSPTEVRERGREGETDEVAELVDEIADMIAWDDAGMPPEWGDYEFGHRNLFKIWREAEKYVGRLQQSRIQGFILGWIKSGEQT